MSSITTTSIASVLTDYVALHDVEIKEQFFIGRENDTLSYCDLIPSDAQEGNEIGVPTFEIGEVWQGFQVNFTPNGDNEFGANKTTQRRHKVDLKIEPDKLVGQWEAHLASMVRNARAGGNKMYNETQARQEMPITNYIINMALRKLVDDRERKVIYGGKYVAPVTDTPNAAVNAVDGFEEMINAAKDAGDLTPFTMGSYTSTEVFEYFETFLSNIPEVERDRPWRLFVSPDNYLNYGRDKRNAFQWQQSMEQLLGVDFSRMQIVPLKSLAGKSRIFATLPGNMAAFYHRTQEADNIQIQAFDRIVKVMFDWHECYAIKDWRHFYSNDLEFPAAGSGSASGA